jgi:hypothetical protein
MSLIDLILNLAGLLLWLNWRSLGFKGVTRPNGVSLLSTLKYAGTPKGKSWILLISLAGLLWVRSLAYWQIGSTIDWMANLKIGVVDVTFRSDYLGRMHLFSFCSFVRFFVIFYLWLLLVSAVNRKLPDNDPLQRWVRLHLGWLERLPTVVKLLSPFFAGAAIWAACSALFAWFGLLPPPASRSYLSQQALVMGFSAFLVWKNLLITLFLINLLNAYVFLGNWPLWNSINATGRNLLRPIQRLALGPGKMDVSPLLGLVLVILISELASRGLERLFQRLPLW